MGKLIQRCLTLLFCLVVSCSVILTGCSNPQAISSDANSDNSTPTTANAASLTMSNYKPRLDGKATVEMKINGSPVIIEVDGVDAPITAGNFVDLVERGFYNGLTFHRVVKEPQPFVAQGGDPQGTGMGGFVDPASKKPRYVPLEIKLKGQAEPTYSKGLGQQAGFSAPQVVLNHKRGAVAMARAQAPDSASSQFYFALSDLDFLDGDYAVFGYVTQGMDVVDKIKQGDRIESAKVTSGLENLKK
ncbi:peptidylprolyl isomerase [Gloeothece verrucosa]|uniref:Peptidyl-prolyl cis-trans isomerase n=1 Tax=Gloeothece verrucosa (strain PCC 7822) TaxID=497965 RepID=E0U7J2_GLOV7|nr:peptidylprolyl isomerase [Gloeothece verrucosa]ADN13688.1 peptidyl-prolyl cis-trans isomerase cyclophilin type [Gloeothece verrucosa PCC 7822]